MEDFIEKIVDNALILLLFPLTFFVVYTIHEFGHYIAARLFRIRIHDFSLGYGRELWGRTDRHGTRWSVKALPLYGHIHIAGRTKQSCESDDGLFDDKPRWQQLVTVAAGPAINFILPFFLLLPFFAIVGQPVMPPIVTGIEIGKPGERDGLQIGDVILEINGTQIYGFQQFSKFSRPLPPEPMQMKIRRGEEIIKKTVTPEVASYVSRDGLKTEHGRVGVIAQQRPFGFKVLKEVNGRETNKDDDLARALLLENLGREAVLGLRGPDRKTHYYRVYLDPETNSQLKDPEHKYYDGFFTGTLKDNYYRKLSLSQSLFEAARQTVRLIVNISTIPGQMFPIDREKVQAEAIVSNDTSMILRAVFSLLFMTSVMSVVVGLVNLVPFPGLDGSRLLLIISEGLAGPEKTEKNKAWIIAGALFVMYLGILFANLEDIPVYLDAKLQNIQESLED